MHATLAHILSILAQFFGKFCTFFPIFQHNFLGGGTIVEIISLLFCSVQFFVCNHKSVKHDATAVTRPGIFYEL